MQTLIRIKLWDQTVKTKISRNKGKNPIWNQNLTVARNLQCKTQNIANIEIWENDEWNANKFLGSSLLNIDELDLFGDKKKNAKWIDLVNENKNIGRVLLSFEWKLQEKKVVTPINPWNTEEKLKESKEKMSKGANNKQIILNSKKCKLMNLLYKNYLFTYLNKITISIKY